MRNPTQLQQALLKIPNVTKFCRRHRLAERTVWRIRSGGTARLGTLVMIDQALTNEKRWPAAIWEPVKRAKEVAQC